MTTLCSSDGMWVSPAALLFVTPRALRDGQVGAAYLYVGCLRYMFIDKGGDRQRKIN